MSGNRGGLKAKSRKDDEYYTQLSDIEQELSHYVQYLKDKTIYCNCDNPSWSQFFTYFISNFTRLGLNKVIFTFYDQHPYSLTITDNGKSVIKKELMGNGSFDSKECVSILEQSDIVITNPPFSRFRDFVSLLVEHDKQFLIIGNKNAIICKEIFPLVQSGRLWFGYTRPNTFFSSRTHDIYDLNGYCRWYTNLPVNRNNMPKLTKTYNPYTYPKYDNSDAIHIDKLSNIPIDYNGVMGVPMTFLDIYDKDVFTIVGFRKGDDGKDLRLNGKEVYTHMLIKWGHR